MHEVVVKGNCESVLVTVHLQYSNMIGDIEGTNLQNSWRRQNLEVLFPPENVPMTALGESSRLFIFVRFFPPFETERLRVIETPRGAFLQGLSVYPWRFCQIEIRVCK